MEAYAERHDVRGLMAELTQSIMVGMPEDPRRFLAAEMGRQLQQQTDDRNELGAMPRDSFVLRLHASTGHGREGAGGRVLRWQGVLSSAPSGRMVRYQAERELTEQLRAVIWGGSAGGGEHHELDAEPQLAEAEPSQVDPPDQATPAAAAAFDASSPTEIPHALMLVLSCLDDAGLRREFDAHADLAALAASAEDKGERRMSKVGLAKFMGSKGLAHGDAEVERVMKRVDTNGDFEIDFLEFCALARVNTELELVLRSQKLECILASFFPSPNYGLTTAHSVKGVGARARGRQQVCRGGGERAQRLRDGHAGLLQKRPDAVGRSRAAPDRLLRLLCRRRPPKMGRGR